MSVGTPEQPNPYAVELALAAALAKVVDAQDADITRAWATAWAEVSADLLDILTVILSDVGRVNAAAVVRYERLARTLGAIADRLDDLAGGLAATVTNDLADVLDRAQTGTVELIAAQRLARGVPGREVPTPALEAIVRRTTEQVTSTALPLADETYTVILGELTRGVAAGDNPRQTAARMLSRAENHFNFGRSRAVTIARTETLDAYRDGQQVTQLAHADVLAGWAWLAHLGKRTCRSCLAMHGQIFDLETPGPDDHQQGRCTRMPVVREEDGSVDLSWLPSAEEHFARLDTADQRAILGRRGYDAWVAGDFPIGDWTKRRETDGWRGSQVPASPGDDGAGTRPPSGGDDGAGSEPPVSISDKLDFVDEETRPPVEAAVAEIDRVHRVPAGMKSVKVGEMPLGLQQATSAVGAYQQLPHADNDPHLWLRPPMDHPERPETVVHELGHALDDLIFGNHDAHVLAGSRTAIDRELRDWWSAIEGSAAYQTFSAMAGWDVDDRGPWVRLVSTSGTIKFWSPSDKDLEYLMKAPELFARSYSQWIATRSGAPDMLSKIERRVQLTHLPDGWLAFPAGHLHFYPAQWEHEDFVPIAEAFDALFGSLGLLIQETT